MKETIIVTGGAGFIGQHLSRKLLKEGHKVRILDNFNEQVHASKSLAEDISNDVEIFNGDIRDQDLVKRAVKGSDKLVHLAAETGTGQSMYEIEHYFSVNVQGTANLLDILVNAKESESISSVVVASSRSIYGEGQYLCNTHGIVFPNQRNVRDMKKGDFEVKCPECGGSVTLDKTSESVPFRPMSYYGLTKQIQEQAVLMHAQNRGISGYGLRYQNVYGPGQSLKNPYTGILAIFSNLARQNSDIQVYEDGLESRDFVYIDDVITATTKCVFRDEQFIGALNVGSGSATSVIEVAKKIKTYFNSKSLITIGGEFRQGDIRHNIADISLLKNILGFSPATSFNEGLKLFLGWAETQPVSDKAAYASSVEELSKRGLMG